MRSAISPQEGYHPERTSRFSFAWNQSAPHCIRSLGSSLVTARFSSFSKSSQVGAGEDIMEWKGRCDRVQLVTSRVAKLPLSCLERVTCQRNRGRASTMVKDEIVGKRSRGNLRAVFLKEWRVGTSEALPGTARREQRLPEAEKLKPDSARARGIVNTWKFAKIKDLICRDCMLTVSLRRLNFLLPVGRRKDDFIGDERPECR